MAADEAVATLAAVALFTLLATLISRAAGGAAGKAVRTVDGANRRPVELDSGGKCVESEHSFSRANDWSPPRATRHGRGSEACA